MGDEGGFRLRGSGLFEPVTVMRTRTLLFLAFCCVLPCASAHALKTMIILDESNNRNNTNVNGPLQLVSSNPYDRQILDVAPTKITFTFSQPIKPDKSSLKLYNATGSEIDVGNLESQGLNMSVSVADLTYGRYTIKWRARCLCDDDTQLSDSFHFTIK